MTMELRSDPGKHAAKNFFIIFVDAIFTTIFEHPFTNAQTIANPCPYPTGNAD